MWSVATGSQHQPVLGAWLQRSPALGDEELDIGHVHRAGPQLKQRVSLLLPPDADPEADLSVVLGLETDHDGAQVDAVLRPGPERQQQNPGKSAAQVDGLHAAAGHSVEQGEAAQARAVQVHDQYFRSGVRRVGLVHQAGHVQPGLARPDLPELAVGAGAHRARVTAPGLARVLARIPARILARLQHRAPEGGTGRRALAVELGQDPAAHGPGRLGRRPPPARLGDMNPVARRVGEGGPAHRQPVEVRGVGRVGLRVGLRDLHPQPLAKRLSRALVFQLVRTHRPAAR